MAAEIDDARERTYLCIDLKSFYASVECADRGLDPFTTNLVVADPHRSANTICLAVTPALKDAGVRNRCRVREIPPGIPYITAMPRMRRYLEVSQQINDIYLRFVSAEDVHPYSVDESFIDATPYLKLYGLGAKEFACKLIAVVRDETGITATAGIGTNLFLAKVALDVTAKHASDGIGILDEASFRREIWFHRPITDIWGIGPGIARRLARYGAHDLAGVCSLHPETLRREFGKNGAYLLDHAWGQEPCTIAQIHAYVPRGHSLSNGQVLMRDYSFDEARTVLREMVDASVLELAEQNFTCQGVGLYVGYSHVDVGFWGAADGGSRKLAGATSSRHELMDAFLSLYDETVARNVAIRRINVCLSGVAPAQYAQRSLFDDDESSQREQRLAQASVAVRGKFGANALLYGTSLKEEANARERNQQIGGHRA